jgi:hypothetical protein
VGLLGDTQLGESATLTLVDFGPDVIRPLLPGLNDQKNSAQRQAQEVIEKLVRQQMEVLPRVIGLFRELRFPADERAHEALIGVLINHLADVSLQSLLEGMESEHFQVREGVTQVLIRLVRKDNVYSDSVLQELLKALFREERRPQGASALEQIGEKAVKGVGELVIDNGPEVRQTACRILSNIGKPALPWAYKNKNDLNPLRREAGETVIRNMRAPAIIDYLVDLLASEGLQQVEEVLGIVLERVRGDQKIIPTLLEYIQTYPRDSVTISIVTILLLLPRNIVLSYLDQALAHNPDPQKWLAPTFLLLGMRGGEAKAILLKIARNPQTSHKLLAEIIGILGMLEVHPLVEQYASSVGTPLSSQIRQQQYIELAQRAIGGLLVSGGWNSQELRARQQKATAENELIKHELYTVLLGESYIPHVTVLTKQLADERYAHAEDSRQSQEKIRELNSALTGVKVDLVTKKGELTKKENELQRLNDLLNTANQQIGQLQAENSNLKGQIKHLQKPPQTGW